RPLERPAHQGLRMALPVPPPGRTAPHGEGSEAPGRCPLSRHRQGVRRAPGVATTGGVPDAATVPTWSPLTATGWVTAHAIAASIQKTRPSIAKAMNELDATKPTQTKD